MGLEITPISFRDACSFIAQHRRHHKPPQGHKFSIAVNDGETLVGVAVVSRPVARMLDDGRTAEVTRCCTDGTRNACSALYAACWRAARAMGYRKLITYILGDETGTSIKAAGWRCIGQAGGGSWSRPSRLRDDPNPTQLKMRWEISDEPV